MSTVSRRVLEPGEAELFIARVLAALRPCAKADVAILDAVVAIVDALAGSEHRKARILAELQGIV